MESEKKYSRGSSLAAGKTNKKRVIRSKIRRKRLLAKDEKIEEGLKKAAKAEVLLTEETG